MFWAYISTYIHAFLFIVRTSSTFFFVSCTLLRIRILYNTFTDASYIIVHYTIQNDHVVYSGSICSNYAKQQFHFSQSGQKSGTKITRKISGFV